MGITVFRTFYFQILLLQLMQKRTFAEDICWSTFGDFQYKVLTDVGGTSFTNAVSACEKYNTTLTSVTSYEEDMFLQRFAMSQLGVPVWIGLYRKQDNISWIDGSELDYINKGYSRKHYGEGCVYMFQGWIEASCDDAELYFICKRTVLEANTCTATTELVTTGLPVTTSSKKTMITTAVDETQYSKTDKGTLPEEIIVTTPVDTGNVRSSEKSITDAGNKVDVVSTTEAIKDPTKPLTTVKSESTKPVTNVSVTQASAVNASTTSGLISLTTNTAPETIVSTSDISNKTSSKSTKEDVITYSGVTSSWHSTFEKLLDEMTVKEKPIYKTKEAENSAAIGSVSILFLVGIVVGVVLLDIGTIRHHARMFRNNTKGLCNNCRKEQSRKRSDVFELKEIIGC